MSLQVRPGCVNPLTIMKENKNNPTKRQMSNVQNDKADKLTDLRTKQQPLQNEMILLKSTGSDSAGNTSKKLEALGFIALRRVWKINTKFPIYPIVKHNNIKK